MSQRLYIAAKKIRVRIQYRGSQPPGSRRHMTFSALSELHFQQHFEPQNLASYQAFFIARRVLTYCMGVITSHDTRVACTGGGEGVLKAFI